MSKLSPEELNEVGEFLAGPEWRRALARMLGPLHPDGERESIDPRLPARWHAGTKPIPPWVGPALVHLLESHSEQARTLARRLKGK